MSHTDDEAFDGIILRTYPYAEADLILRVLSPTLGKIGVIAKGARREKSRFQINFDVFDSGSFETRRGKGSLETLSHFRPFQSLKSLRDNLDKFVIGSLLVEAFDLLVHEHTSDAQEYYESLALGLRALEEAADTKEALRGAYFSLHMLLRTSGFGSHDPETAPSRNNLLILLDAVENAAEKQLLTKSSVVAVLQKLT